MNKSIDPARPNLERTRRQTLRLLGASAVMLGIAPGSALAQGNDETVLTEALAESSPDQLFFTAHSLPARIVAEGDGYQDRLLESCRLVEAGMKLPRWEFAFQSASTTGEPWLGPDLLEAVERSGARNVLVCPIGFVADHLEVLYDLDVEAQAFARSRGITIRRTASLNTRPGFIEAMALVVRDALH